MIKSAYIKNFQSHKDSFLEFNPGVNVITGSTDSGKTGIFRAIRLAVNNKPNGVAYKSNWGGETSVELEMDNCTVKRTEGKERSYVLSTIDTPFEAFGKEVPEEIKKALNLSEINLQSQLDRPFLLTSTSGEVAQHFNRIAHLDQIDVGLKNINSSITKIKQGNEKNKEDLKALDEKLKSFEYLKKFEIELEVLETMQSDFITQQSKKGKLNGLIQGVKEIIIDAEKHSFLLSAEKPLNIVLRDIEKKKAWEKENDKLKDLISSIKGISQDREEYDFLLEGETKVSGLLNHYKVLGKQKLEFEKLEGLKNDIEFTVLKIKTKATNLSTLQEEYDTKFPDICPFCKTDLTKK